ncbi:MAG: protein translocase subunit SecD [Actinomycetales bacterium]|nr:protein translocase subunit SecD [Actinomycetales bacterium]
MKLTPALWRLVSTILVLGLAAGFTLFKEPSLGLDLRGGTQMTLQAQDTDRQKADAEATDRVLEVLRGRVDALGVSEPTLARSGENRIIVELPDVQDPAKAAEVIGQTATLGFREVLAPANETTEPGEGEVILPDESGQMLLLGPVTVDGEGISDAKAQQPQDSLGSWVVNVDFNRDGRKPWKDLVASACANPVAGNRIAIVLDEEVISSPGIVAEMCQSGGGIATSITGDFSFESANDLAILIKAGALPVPVKIIDQRTVGPTLGAAAIDASIKASILGLILTGIFIVFAYRLVGLVATIGLASYALISYGLLVWIGATLTLPGLAGFVLAIGLAIDANVLVFERAKEEYADVPQAGLAPALKTGFNKAWSAILDSNVTTVLAAVLLFFLAAGPVKGFGVTLTIGTIASMFSALVVARVIAEWAVKRKFVINRPGMSGIAGKNRIRIWLNEKGPDLMRRAKTWVMLTVAVAAVSIGGIVAGVNMGVEFTGGRILEFTTTNQVNPERVREAVSDAGFPTAVVQTSSGDGINENITVRTGKISEADAVDIKEAVASVTGGAKQLKSDSIDPTLGKELRNKALLAFAIAIGAQMLYMAWRFRWTWAVSAIVSMTSVVLAIVGIWAWWDKPIDGVFLAAILSIIGLAVNDTIVVFDRIREELHGTSTENLRPMVNEAILSTLPRTINTGLGAMLILGALAVFGGDSLRDFSLALILGLGIGTLATIFTASSLAVLLEERWPFNPEKKPKKVIDPYAHVGNGREDGAVI